MKDRTVNSRSVPPDLHNGRRDFMKLMAASIALGGVGGCSPPPEKIVPYARSPEGLVPGEPVFYATAMVLDGFAKGVLVECNMGRPTKVEGNRLHPASLGATDVFAQASVLGLWDPDRSQAVMREREISSWPNFLTAMAPEVLRLRQTGGAGLRLLTGTITSPTLGAQIQSLLAAYPEARWHVHQPLDAENHDAASTAAFGTPLDCQVHLEKADVIVSLDADFLGAGAASLRSARHFAARRGASGAQAMTRLYAVESSIGVTGAMADHRLPVRPTGVETFARLVAARLGLAVSAPSAPDQRMDAFAAAVVVDLSRHRGRSVVIAGERQPPAVHVLAHALNAELGGAGATVTYTDPVAVRPPVAQGGSLGDLVAALAAGEVDMLVIAGSNPVATAPVDLDFGTQLARARLAIHMGLYRDETGNRTRWHVPEAHYMETWSDARAFDGTATIVQPLIAPLYAGVSIHALIAALIGDSGRTAHALVREHWQQKRGSDFEAFWQQALHDGIVPDTAFPRKSPAFRHAALAALTAPVATDRDSLEIVFAPDPCVWDGQFANNAWLQELPKPITTLTWDNAALLGPATAERLGLETDDLVELQHRERSVLAPVRVVPGHPDGTVTAPLGYGRARAGSVGSGRGFDAYALRLSSAPWIGSQVTLRKTGRRRRLAATQTHHRMSGRDPVRTATAGEFAGNPDFARGRANASLYPRYPRGEYAWAMSIDLGACIGCNACTIACQAENNIPVVGKEEVDRGREMHWIRVDTYLAGPAAHPTTHFQPVPCMHCEDAPCELVCPVGATMHDAGGLNVQVYNRCIGTRFCSNNCPYKVRRFNFLQFADEASRALRAQRNPEVTVRRRGVMEKCTYCVQRITRARIDADRRGGKIRDGDVVTACEAACPTGAIVFGNLAEPASRVARAKHSPLDYTLLEEENTRPRTTYLAKLTNPNPDFEREGS